MAEKVYLTADQYVVKCLEEKDQQIAKQEEKYDDLLARFVKLQAKLKELDELKAMFECKVTINKNGFEINYNPEHNKYGHTIMYSWELEPEKQSDEFKSLLNILGLELPKLELEDKKED